MFLAQGKETHRSLFGLLSLQGCGGQWSVDLSSDNRQSFYIFTFACMQACIKHVFEHVCVCDPARLAFPSAEMFVWFVVPPACTEAPPSPGGS